jgi:hypothetical protein
VSDVWHLSTPVTVGSSVNCHKIMPGGGGVDGQCFPTHPPRIGDKTSHKVDSA